MADSEVYETRVDYEDVSTYETHISVSTSQPARYTVLVITKNGGHPMCFCGHLHRSYVAAEHCAKGQVGCYVEWRRVVKHNAEEIKRKAVHVS